jgi:hypothetical protein
MREARLAMILRLPVKVPRAGASVFFPAGM